MKNGQTPIHLQRWAPADYLADEHVKLLQARRDYATLIFYRHFLDASFVAGGDLPADPEMLAAVVSMPRKDVERALAFCVGRLIMLDGDRLYQPRVRREIAEELEFRSTQKARGSKGAAKRWQSDPNGTAMVAPSTRHSPPAPFASRLSPAPTPAPQEAPSPPPEDPPDPEKRPAAAAALASIGQAVLGAVLAAQPVSTGGQSPAGSWELTAPGPKPKKVKEPLSAKILAEFETLWDICEKRVGKESALRAFAQQRKSGKMPDVGTVRLALCKLQETEQWSREGRRYQPHLATWLNRGGWHDRLPRSNGSSELESRRASNMAGVDPERAAMYRNPGEVVSEEELPWMDLPKQ